MTSRNAMFWSGFAACLYCRVWLNTLSTVETMKLRPSLVFAQTYLVDDEDLLCRSQGHSEREKFLEHLARKLVVLVETEPIFA